MEENSYKKVKKYSLKIIPLLMVFLLLDFFSTFLAIKVFEVAEEKNPIALALWNTMGFFLGSLFLIAIMFSILFFMYYAVLFAPTNKQEGRAVLIVAGCVLVARAITNIIVLINNYAILTEFFLSKL